MVLSYANNLIEISDVDILFTFITAIPSLLKCMPLSLRSGIRVSFNLDEVKNMDVRLLIGIGCLYMGKHSFSLK